MNRARKVDEDYEDYKADLKHEAQVMKFRLKGRWVWKTFYPIDSMDNLPRGAQVLQRDEDTGVMIPTKVFDPSKQQHYIKFPPYRAQPDSKRRTFSEQRVTARMLEEAYAEDSGSEEAEAVGEFA